MNDFLKGLSGPYIRPEAKEEFKNLGHTVVQKIKQIKFCTALTVLAVVALQVVAIKVAGFTRGYQAFGGEMLIIPMALFLYFVHKDARRKDNE